MKVKIQFGRFPAVRKRRLPVAPSKLPHTVCRSVSQKSEKVPVFSYLTDISILSSLFSRLCVIRNSLCDLF